MGRGILRSLAEKYKRLRHSHGFGVHSPFGYRVVGRVVLLPRGYGYYSERYLERPETGLSDTHELSGCRLLGRLAIETDARSAYIQENLPAGYANYLRFIRSDIRLERRPEGADTCALICISGTAEAEWGARRIGDTNPPAALLALDVDDATARRLCDAMPEGLCLRGKRNLILMPRAEMRKVIYTVKI